MRLPKKYPSLQLKAFLKKYPGSKRDPLTKSPLQIA